MNLSEAIKSRRKALDLTQEELAEKLGVNTSYIGQLESGHRTGLTANMLFKLAKALEVDCSYFQELFPDEPEEDTKAKGKRK
jgi:transcriptional regulator with XRE-family HTH domain